MDSILSYFAAAIGLLASGGEQTGVQIQRGFRCVRVVQPPEETVDRSAGQHGKVQIDGMKIRPEILKEKIVVADE